MIVKKTMSAFFRSEEHSFQPDCATPLRCVPVEGDINSGCLATIYQSDCSGGIWIWLYLY